jgi:hypothetical protein
MRTDNEWLGSAEGPSGSFVVNSYGTFIVIYTVGKYGIDDGGSIRIARRGGMRPQVNDPKAPGYTTISSKRKVRFIADSIPVSRITSRQDGLFGSSRGSVRAGHVRPFWGAFQVDVRDGSLYEGDQVVVTFGDTSQGSPGIRLKATREAEHLFKVFVDPFGTGLFKPIHGSPYITIIGDEAKEIQVVGPSQVTAGSPFSVTVRALDAGHNRSDPYRGKVSFDSEDPDAKLPGPYDFKEEDVGAHLFTDVTLSKPGLQRITVKDDSGLFVRDVAALDFTGWQGNDFQITVELWEHVKDQIRRYHEPGRFVTFLGYEWSGLTPGGGDHNIYYLGDNEPIHRSDQWLIEDKVDPETDRYPISELWETFKGRRDVLAIPHVGGRHANLDFYDPEHIPLIEVHSNHGTFEWFLEEAMRRRMKVGFIAASDDHSSRPGLTYPSGGMTTRGGYTGVYAEELTREALWEAFWARRAYGTSGERIIVHVESDGHLMGEEYSTSKAPEIKVKIAGTSALHEVEVKNWEKTIHRHPFAEPADESEKLFKVEWSGARVRSRPKVVTWDGGLTVKDGSIVDYREFAFDYSYQGVEKVSDQELKWTSSTGGDPDGVLLKMVYDEDTEVTFETEPVTFTFRPAEIGYEPRVVEAGGLNQRVKVSTVKDETPDTLEFSFRDQSAAKGLNAYWVRIVQADGAMAWSSPIFIDCT